MRHCVVLQAGERSGSWRYYISPDDGDSVLRRREANWRSSWWLRPLVRWLELGRVVLLREGIVYQRTIVRIFLFNIERRGEFENTWHKN